MKPEYFTSKDLKGKPGGWYLFNRLPCSGWGPVEWDVDCGLCRFHAGLPDDADELVAHYPDHRIYGPIALTPAVFELHDELVAACEAVEPFLQQWPEDQALDDIRAKVRAALAKAKEAT